MSSTIPEVITTANSLYTGLAADLDISFDFPEVPFPAEIPFPDEDGPAFADVVPMEIGELTSGTMDGTGVFDVLMKSVNCHLVEQYTKGRITGADYAKAYMSSVHAVMQYGVQFLLGKDRAYWENLNAQAQLQIAQVQRVRAIADAHIARFEMQKMAYEAVHAQFAAYTARNQYAISKMSLVEGYNGILSTEAQIVLTLEQVDVQRSQTKDTLLDGQPVAGVVEQDKMLKEAQALTAKEQLDSARAQTKDTLLDGSPISGLVAIDKAYKEAQQIHMEHQGQLVLEQVESQRAQTRDTLTTGETIQGLLALDKQIKTAQVTLTKEQAETQRAQTWETHTDGTPIAGIAQHEKSLKQAQAKLVDEQYESQRGQARGTLSTGETVVGLIGAQTLLYNEQVTSYKRDAESKAFKMVLDSWIARKTIDEGVAVPVNIDTARIDSMATTYFGNLDFT